MEGPNVPTSRRLYLYIGKSVSNFTVKSNILQLPWCYFIVYVKSVPDPEMIAMQSYPCNNHRGGECEIVSTVGTFTKSINHNTKRTIVISNGRTLRRLQFPSDPMPSYCVLGCCAKNYFKNESVCLQNRKVNPQIAHSIHVFNYLRPRHPTHCFSVAIARLIWAQVRLNYSRCSC